MFDQDRCGDAARKSSAQWFQGRVKRGWEGEIRPAVCQENPLRRAEVSVPQTDTGGRDEYSQALG